jgi:hypothetical protein
MLAGSLLGTEAWCSTASLLTWRERVTKSGRLLFQLAPSVPRTGETGSGLLHTPKVMMSEESYETYLARMGRKTDPKSRGKTKPGNLAMQISTLAPTPTASDAKGAVHGRVRKGKEGTKLSTAVAMLPTPRAHDGTKGGPNSRDGSGSPHLSSVIAMLPTPNASDGERGAGTHTITAENGRAVRTSKTTGQKFGARLADAIGLLPTPRAGKVTGESAESWDKRNRDKKVATPPLALAVGKQTGLRLQPSFVEWMMGYPPGWTDLSSPEPAIETPGSKA